MGKNLQSIYENMKSKPGFNDRVLLEQPTPHNESKQNTVSRSPSMPQLSEMQIISKRLDNIEKSLKMIMETHTKLIERL